MRLLLLFAFLALDCSACELLIKAVSATNAIPEKDARGCYKRGDLVEVFRDGRCVGTAVELPPADGGKFVRIRICKADGSELLPSELRAMILAKWPTFGGELDGDATHRRIIGITLDLFTAPQINALNNIGTLGFTEKGQAQITITAARARIVNKLTGESP